MLTDLKDILEKSATLPYLFIGSGISRRYLNAPTWEKLLEEMCGWLKLKKPFNFYLSSNNSDLPKVAEQMAIDLHEIWWTEERFQKSRATNAKKIRTKTDCLKYEISNYLDNKLKISEKYAEEISLLQSANVNGIITTNWDCFLDEHFGDFKVFVGQEQMIFNNRIGLAEIFKIHGSVKEPNSIIVTDEDYKNFNQRNPYLAAKLLTTFLEHPIIFLGYSLADKNIQEILKSITSCLQNDNLTKLQNHLIFIQRSKDGNVGITESVMSIDEVSIPIIAVKIDDFSELYRLLGSLKRRLPLKYLIQIEKMVYDIVKNKDATSKVYVADRVEETDLSGSELVFGIGLKNKLSSRGVTGLRIIDLMKDVIDPSLNEYDVIVKEAFPILMKTSIYIPYFRSLSEIDCIASNGSIKKKISEYLDKSLSDKIERISVDSFSPGSSYSKWSARVNQECKSVKEIDLSDDTMQHKIIKILLLNPRKIDLDQMCAFIRKNDNSDNMNNTNFRKLICMYDYLMYRKPK